MPVQPVPIVDPDDPRVEAYHAIRERDLIGRQGMFIAEGKVVLNVLFAAKRYEVFSVLVLESRLAGMAETLSRAPAHVPVYVASQAVMDKIAGFHIHRGILALGRRGPEIGPDELLLNLPDNALVVALVGISNHDNVGSIFRNAASFNADAVLLDNTCCDPLYRKSIRVSVGAALKVPFAYAGSAEALSQALDRHGFRQVALAPKGKHKITSLPPAKKNALLLGSEGDGLPPHLIQRLDTVRIPMSDSFDSLNVAAASAIALHRLWRG